MDFDFQFMDAKWNKVWSDKKIYEPVIDKSRKKKFITAAFPYPNSPQHVGHGRTYTTADIYARYLRLEGYNVLFPMAFHVTGTPILAMAERLKSGDKELIKIFEDIYHIPRDQIDKLTEPKDLVMYFSKEIERGMKEIGFSIDWRRKFYSMDKHFNKYIEWQFHKLYEAGLITKGEHTVPWCPHDKNPVGSHDTRGDVDPELEEITGVLFKFEDAHLVTATYRPETLYGLTNIWINPNAKYVKVKTKFGNLWVAKDAYEGLKYQFSDGSKEADGKLENILDEKDGNYFIGKTAKDLLSGRDIPIYKATFVKSDGGTGIVMSVPAHAPFDYLALRDLVGKDKADKMLISIIKTDGFGTYPAKEYVEELGVKNQDDPNAEKATKFVYSKEARKGVMSVGKYKGKPVSKAKEFVRTDLISEKKAIPLFIIANSPVYCRCGAKIVANVVKNQWFINYGNADLKEKSRQLINKMSIIPEKMRIEFIRTIDWLKEKACTRAKGLGTKFPFDKLQMIEALSDSTLYMAFYTIVPHIRDLDPSLLDESFFDYVLLGKGNPPQNPDIVESARKARESFEYWYPVDSRHSAHDLVRNHLPFYIMNHVAVFPEKYWPVQIVTNGFVLMDGTKMSKSFGNILPIRDAIKQYGADVVRFSVVSGADLSQDTDFNRTVAEGTISRLRHLFKMVSNSATSDSSNSPDSDSSDSNSSNKWLMYMLDKRIEKARDYYKKVDIRSISLELFYSLYSDLQWYKVRYGKTATVPKDFFKKWAIVMSPLMPHIAEEIWSMLGFKGLVVEQKYPEFTPIPGGEELINGENLIRQTVVDINTILELLKSKAIQKSETTATTADKTISTKSIDIFVSSGWKYELYNIVRKEKTIPNVMGVCKQDDVLSRHMKEIPKVGRSWFKNPYSMKELPLDAKSEYISLHSAKDFLSKLFGCSVKVSKEEGSSYPKAKSALPNKPSIKVNM